MESAKVVVIGTGLAGLTAAYTAASCGAKVTIIEKEHRLGGNSSKATSGINAVGTFTQLERNIIDSFSKFREDTTKVGGGIGDSKLVDILARESNDAFNFLRTFGLYFTEVSICGGHSVPRTHRFPPTQDGQPVPVGFTIIKHISAELLRNPNVTIIKDAEVLALRWKSAEPYDKDITGISYRTADSNTLSLDADAVILATGGSAYDRGGGSLLAEFSPTLCTLPTTSGSHADGAGIRMGRAIGAELVDMDKVQIHPTGFVQTNKPGSLSKWLCPEALRGSGAVLVNDKGLRFADELGSRSYLTHQIFAHGAEYQVRLESGREQRVAYLIFDSQVCY